MCEIRSAVTYEVTSLARVVTVTFMSATACMIAWRAALHASLVVLATGAVDKGQHEGLAELSEHTALSKEHAENGEKKCDGAEVHDGIARGR